MGEGTRREREGAGRAPDRDTQAGVEKVVSPPPSGKRRGRRLQSSWVRDRLGGSMTRPVGTATWVRGRGGGGGGAPMSWMGSEGLAGGGRQCSGPFWWRGGIGLSRSARARLADRHFTSCREGGGSRGNSFLQGWLGALLCAASLWDPGCPEKHHLEHGQSLRERERTEG